MAGKGSRSAACESAVRDAFDRPQICHPAARPGRTAAGRHVTRDASSWGLQQAVKSCRTVPTNRGGWAARGSELLDAMGAESNTQSAQRNPFRSDRGTGVWHETGGDGRIQDVSDAQRRCACCCTDHRRIAAHAESAPERNRAPSLTAHRLDLWKPPPCELPCTSHLPADLRFSRNMLTGSSKGPYRLETRISRRRNAIPEGPINLRTSDPPQMR